MMSCGRGGNARDRRKLTCRVAVRDNELSIYANEVLRVVNGLVKEAGKAGPEAIRASSSLHKVRIGYMILEVRRCRPHGFVPARREH